MHTKKIRFVPPIDATPDLTRYIPDTTELRLLAEHWAKRLHQTDPIRDPSTYIEICDRLAKLANALTPETVRQIID
jgi:hypothetical protein